MLNAVSLVCKHYKYNKYNKIPLTAKMQLNSALKNLASRCLMSSSGSSSKRNSSLVLSSLLARSFCSRVRNMAGFMVSGSVRGFTLITAAGAGVAAAAGAAAGGEGGIDSDRRSRVRFTYKYRNYITIFKKSRRYLKKRTNCGLIHLTYSVREPIWICKTYILKIPEEETVSFLDEVPLPGGERFQLRLLPQPVEVLLVLEDGHGLEVCCGKAGGVRLLVALGGLARAADALHRALRLTGRIGCAPRLCLHWLLRDPLRLAADNAATILRIALTRLKSIYFYETTSGNNSFTSYNFFLFKYTNVQL